MNQKLSMFIIGGILVGITLGWTTWVSTSTVSNKVAVAEIKTEIKGMSKVLNQYYVILKEIREDQRMIINEK